MSSVSVMNVESGRKRFRPLAIAFLVLTSFGLAFIFLWPPCDYSCRAHALYKNAVFFELRDLVTTFKANQTSPISVAASRFSDAQLRENGVRYWAVIDSGVIFLGDSHQEVLLVAEPFVVKNQIVWRCRFYPQPIEIPLCPSELK